MGIGMMLKAIVENVDADFYYHRLTICNGYEKYGVKGTWKPFGFDVALDLGGDTFTTYYGILQFLRHFSHLFLLILFKQPFILFAQTFSPYGFVSRRIACYVMRRARAITVREKKSKDLLEDWGIPCNLTADIAFILEKQDGEDYHGSSYHGVIGALISGNEGLWNGERANNWKFSIFNDQFNLERYQEEAWKNIELLYSVL